jgi:hypothetical protein
VGVTADLGGSCGGAVWAAAISGTFNFFSIASGLIAQVHPLSAEQTFSPPPVSSGPDRHTGRIRRQLDIFHHIPKHIRPVGHGGGRRRLRSLRNGLWRRQHRSLQTRRRSRCRSWWRRLGHRSGLDRRRNRRRCWVCTVLGGTGIGADCTGLGVGWGTAFSTFGSGFASTGGNVTSETSTAERRTFCFLKELGTHNHG